VHAKTGPQFRLRCGGASASDGSLSSPGGTASCGVQAGRRRLMAA
jgi:hypothetical protein